ncbi:hypothetical protein QBC41DRAFT_318450 [Cercophora samala]|uniref:Uncharacterized protein n=1 Tax=Cercophora samala TaxID=330535 RepID=A0AA39ZG85_9PEZI|nr:hypothetical protein QBC41DRAFT_318450 [Cercophora samala]
MNSWTPGQPWTKRLNTLGMICITHVFFSSLTAQLINDFTWRAAPRPAMSDAQKFARGEIPASEAGSRVARPQTWPSPRCFRRKRVRGDWYAVMMTLAVEVCDCGGPPVASGCRGLHILRYLVLSWRCWVWGCLGVESPNPGERQESALCGGCPAAVAGAPAFAAAVDVAVELAQSPLMTWAYCCWRRQGCQFSLPLGAV